MIKSANIQGIAWMITSCFALSVMITIVRYISYDMNIFQIVFLRNLIAVSLFLPWMIYLGIDYFKTSQIKTHLARSATGLVSMYFWFYAITVVPLSVATSLSFTAPLFTATLAIFIFKERGSIGRLAALLIGFVGTLIVIRPGFEGFDANSLFVIAATSLWACSSILIKILTKKDSPTKVTFYMALIMVPLSMPLAIIYWEPISNENIIWLIALAITANIFQLTISKAFSKTDLTVVLPFDFTRLIFISIIAYFTFGEVVNLWTLIGSIIIMSSAVYAAYLETKFNKIVTNID